MATRAAIAYRDAEVQKRLGSAVEALAANAGAPMPDRPAYVRDPAYRAVDERDWLATALERVVAAQKGTDG